MSSKPTAVGLFAGIGGIELGLGSSGFETEMLCEVDDGAVAVLEHWMPNVPVHRDIRSLRSLPHVDLVAAGFPCQDLSQAGRTAGITGSRSSLVEEVFRLVRRKRGGPRWLLLENVPFMLQLDCGSAMRFVTSELEALGYRWAYRVVDARAFGLPQRRQRVIILASRTDDPRPVLFADRVEVPENEDPDLHACGFYWTEGLRGLGWAVNAVPTLKAGSSVGIASPPAIRLATDRQLVTPSIEDVERLQGFPAGWTYPSVSQAGTRAGHRWKLVGNAVSVPVAEWVGERILNPGEYSTASDRQLSSGMRWPSAAWGWNGQVHAVETTTWPVAHPYQDLESFLEHPRPLSARATAGFLRRAESGSLRFIEGFLDDVSDHLRRVQGDAA